VSACGVDHEPLAGDAGTGTSGEVEATSSGAASTTIGTEATSDEPAGETTTGQADESTGMDEDGFIPRPDGGGAPAGICIGIDDVGHLATVHGATQTPVDPSCSPRPAPCGGDIVGSWTIQGHCGLESLPNLFESECPGSTMAYLSSDVQGTSTFGADLTFTMDGNLSLDVEIVLDTMACFGVECEAFGELISDEAENVEAVCGESPESVCACLMTITSDRSSAGTYDVTADGLVLTVDGVPGDPIPTCVDADRLTLWDSLQESQAYPTVPCDDAADCEAALGDAHETWLCAQ